MPGWTRVVSVPACALRVLLPGCTFWAPSINAKAPNAASANATAAVSRGLKWKMRVVVLRRAKIDMSFPFQQRDFRSSAALRFSSF
jgi:hypothetical protein